MTDVAHLKQAEAPTKATLLAYLDELRAGIEAGEVLALICIPVHPNREFSTRSVGDIRALEMAGMLGRAWMDAADLLKQ